MSSNKVIDPVPPSDSAPKSKSKKKKKGGGKNKVNGQAKNDSSLPDPGGKEDDQENDEPEEDADEPDKQLKNTVPATTSLEKNIEEGGSQVSKTPPEDTPVKADEATPLRNGMQSLSISNTADASQRFEALVRDRDTLRAEVTELRKSLEELQAKHESDAKSIKEQLEESQAETSDWQSKYTTLQDNVNTLKAQVRDRFKANAEEIADKNDRIDELEGQTSDLNQELSAKKEEVAAMAAERESAAKELSSLRNRTNLSQQNWQKERGELEEQENYLREEFENAKQAMHDWEVLALEERSMRRDLADKVGDLEEQATNYRSEYERVSREKESQTVAIDGLQKALQEIQVERKKELRETVENSQMELEKLRSSLRDAEQSFSVAKQELDSTKAELERTQPFEKEVKEKNLLIGKLRHEAVTLNEHLTNALRLLKHMKGKPEESVDRQIITTYLLKFLQIDRSDPRKFEVLRLIADLLRWSDEEKEQAGLLRQASSAQVTPSSSSLNLPTSPLQRHQSNANTLAHMSLLNDGAASVRKESLAELWQTFLEEQAAQGQGQEKRERQGTVGGGEGMRSPK
ncbi:MAG: hypothetical protein Q9227_006469 [Pyrenula ochraceoflavens]